MKSHLHHVALIAAFGVIGQARAQQTVVPLDRFDDRVGITIGVNGGAAKEYLFDTGSDLFNIAIGNGPSPAWFPNYSGPKNQNSLTSYMYGDGTYGYLYGKTTISTIQFYASSTSQTPVSNGSFGPYTGGTLPAGAVVYDIATAAVLNEREQQQGILITNPDVTPNTFYQNLTWQNKLSAGAAPEEGRLFGTFGASDYGASILGRLTNTGYVVEANGTTTTPGQCGVACLIIGLTPELRAQFFSIVPWSSTAPERFPISGAPASTQYGVTFNYVLGSGTNTSSSKLATLLDTGYPGNEMNSAAVFNAQNGFGNLTSIKGTGGNYVVAGLSFNLTGDSAGAQTVAATTSGVAMKGNDVVSSDFLNTVQVSNKATNEAIAGLSFYTTNAVMYDLQNAAIGYTPFYVTVAPFTNGLAVSQDMGPLGVAGVISGQNGVAINPNGIAYLTAANTYTGATTVAQSAWLGVGGPGSIAASSNVAVDGTLDRVPLLERPVNSLAFGRRRRHSRADHARADEPRPELSPAAYTIPTRPAASPSPIRFRPTSPQGYGGVIIAGGVETFSGDNGYAGKTGIGEAGGLILTGTLENSAVLNAGYFQNDGLVRLATMSTGTIGGSGNFAGGLYAASGVVAPGDPRQGTPGHLTIGTAFGLGSDASYLVRSAGANASRIDVEGQAAIQGSTLDAIFGTPAQLAVLGQNFTVLTASNGILGQFGVFNPNTGTPMSQYPFLNANLGYAADAVTIDLSRSGIPFVAAARTRNEFGVATGLDTMNPWLPASFAATSLNFATAPGAFDALAGDLHSSLRTSLVENAYDLGAAALAQLDAAECDWSAPGQVVSYGEGQAAANDGACRNGRRAAWIQAYDSWSRNGGANGVSGLLGASGGFIGGVDAPAPGDWRIGGLLGYAHSRFSADNTPASGSADNVSVGAYAGRLWGPVGLKLGGAYTWNMVSTTRTVSFPGFRDQVASDYGGGTAQAFADLSYRLAFQGLSAEPFANLAYVNQNMQSFAETGFGGAALHGNSPQMGVTFTTLGARFARGFLLGQYALEADATLGYRHAFGTVTPTTYENFLFGGAGFDTEGAPVARNVALVSLGARVRVTNNIKLGLAYVGEYGGSYAQSGVKANVDWSF